MITIETTRFGKIDIDNPRVITMKEDGILGFSHLKKFVLLMPDKKKSFWWLQSLEDGSVAFIVTDPFRVKADYDVDLSTKESEALDIQSAQDIAMLCIVTVNKTPSLKITVNLRAPIIINMRDMVARQVILFREDYEIRHEIQGMQETAGQGAAERMRALCG
jgi:flagellar assembly factor FliW